MSENHKENAPLKATIAVISISSTRKIEDDKSGQYITTSAGEHGFEVCSHIVVDDEVLDIRDAVLKILKEGRADAVLLTGGTGITRRDVTIEAVKPLFDKELSSYGTLFAMLSYDEIGSAAVLSRATAGIIGKTSLFCMPGSEKACRLACEKIIFKEILHIKKHLND